ncbi:unnamed protein product [Musa acuminata subsp. burmannicoides]
MKTPNGSITTPKAAAIAASWACTTPLLFPDRPKGKYEQPRAASLPPMGIPSTVLLRVVGAAGFGWWKYAGGFGKEGVLWVVVAILAAPVATANRQIRTAIGPKRTWASYNHSVLWCLLFYGKQPSRDAKRWWVQAAVPCSWYWKTAAENCPWFRPRRQIHRF